MEFWCHKKVDKITSPYSANVSSEYNSLLNYIEGGSFPPSSEEAEYALSTLTENLKIENCHVNEGVIASITDPDYGSESKPYKAHSIPGTIPAVHYDIGNWGGHTRMIIGTIMVMAVIMMVGRIAMTVLMLKKHKLKWIPLQCRLD